LFEAFPYLLQQNRSVAIRMTAISLEFVATAVPRWWVISMETGRRPSVTDLKVGPCTKSKLKVRD
jgi:hypothetical protein